MATISASKTMRLIYPKSYNARPHVTTRYDDSALTNQAAESQKNIFLIGSATEGNPDNVYEVKSSVQARAIFGSGDLVDAMELIWNPDGDFFQNGGTVYAQRVENAEPASLTVGPITFNSKVYGSSSNEIGISLTKDAVSNAYRLNVEYDPKTYSNNYTNIGNIFEIYHGGRSDTANAYGYKVEGSGVRATKFTLATGNDASSLQPVMSFDLTKDGFDNVEKLITAINAVPGFQAAPLKACAYIKTATLDLTPKEKWVPVGDRDQYAIVSAFYGDLVYATRYDPYITVTVNKLAKPSDVQATPTDKGATISATPQIKDLEVFEKQYMTGGDDGHVPVSWADKFKSVHGRNVYYIVPLTDADNVHAELQEFLNEENILGYNYMAFVGGGYNEDLNVVLNRQLALRSDRVALVANSGYYRSLSGREIHIPAYEMAAYVAGVASSLPVGYGCTNKYLQLTQLDQNFSGEELDTLDENGIIAIEHVINRNATGGYRIVEDVTTYNSTNETVKNLVSLRELTDFLFDDLRIYLEENFIGTPVHQVTASLLASNIEAFLMKRVSDGMLASYDRSSITCMIDGNKAYISFSCAPARELREIVVSGTYTNFTSELDNNGGNQGIYSNAGVNQDTTVAGMLRQNTQTTHYLGEGE